MKVIERLGVFEDVVAVAPEHADTLLRLRALVEDVHPDATEAGSRLEKSVWWGVGERKMRDGYAWAMPHANHVNFGFFEGTALEDPSAVLEGTGKLLRHVKLRGPDDAQRPELRALLTAAYERKKAQG